MTTSSTVYCWALVLVWSGLGHPADWRWAIPIVHAQMGSRPFSVPYTSGTTWSARSDGFG